MCGVLAEWIYDFPITAQRLGIEIYAWVYGCSYEINLIFQHAAECVDKDAMQLLLAN